jgi:hypothetical protein
MVEIEDRVNIEIEIYRIEILFKNIKIEIDQIKIILKISKIQYKMIKIEKL